MWNCVSSSDLLELAWGPPHNVKPVKLKKIIQNCILNVITCKSLLVNSSFLKPSVQKALGSCKALNDDLNDVDVTGYNIICSSDMI